jgi:hypothetical protein
VITDSHQYAAVPNFKIIRHRQPIGKTDTPIVALDVSTRKGTVRFRV